jgi:hypothetical protein
MKALIGMTAAVVLAFANPCATPAGAANAPSDQARHVQAESLRRRAQALQAQAKLLMSRAARERADAVTALAQARKLSKASALMRDEPAVAKQLQDSAKRQIRIEMLATSGADRDDAAAKTLLAQAQRMLEQASALDGRR